MNKIADLHVHTTASDGTYSPCEVVELAKKKGYAAIAITDHDTIEGIAEGLDEGQRRGLEVVPGIELSTIYGDMEVHMLGYYLDFSNQLLLDTLTVLIESRDTRAVRMVEKLNHLGHEIDIKQVRRIAGGNVIGRPHIAKALKEKGYIRKIEQAFSDRFLGRGGEAYVERYKLSPEEAIRLITESDGVPILAHPGGSCDKCVITEDDIRKFCDCGLQGLEVFHPNHSWRQTAHFEKLAQKLNILITGGSDFHGNNKSEGCDMGVIKLPYKHVEALKAVASNRRS